MAKRSGTVIRTKIYNKFKGVDFAADPSLVDDSRSPMAVNLISDEGGMPEKRPGYRQICWFDPQQYGNHTINGLHPFRHLWYGVDAITVSPSSITPFVDNIKFSKYISRAYGVYTVKATNPSGNSIKVALSGAVSDSKTFSTGATKTANFVLANNYAIETWGVQLDDPVTITWPDTTVTYKFDFEPYTQNDLVVHYGPNMYVVDATGTIEPYSIYEDIAGEGVTDRPSKSIILNDILYIFTGISLFMYDGDVIRRVDENGYIPLTVIGRTPSGGGETYEAINRMSTYQRVSVQGDGTSTRYNLPYSKVDSVTQVKVNDSVVPSTDYTVTASSGYITFNTAPSAPSVSGQDNVEITFSKKFNGYKDSINNCYISFCWGVGGSDDRIVCSGNGVYKNYDYISGFNDGTYWPDTNYCVVGNASTAILGYRKIGEQLAIIKEPSTDDSTVYLRTGSLDSSGEAVWTTQASIANVGGTNIFGFANIFDEPLYVSSKGVFGITTQILTSEKIVQNRSKRIDSKMLKETFDYFYPKAIGFRNYMLIFFENGHVYLLDGKQSKSYQGKNDSDYTYECNYWEMNPMSHICVMIEDGIEQLYLAAYNTIYKMNFDIDGLYSGDGNERIYKYSDNGLAINAIWSTKADDDGDAMVYKTLLKRGNGVTIKPYTRTSAKVLMRSDRDCEEWLANEGIRDVFDWGDIDFERFTFYSNDAPSEILINRKVKNYKRLQIIVKNDSENEGFGVFAITKHYVTGNFAKR